MRIDICMTLLYLDQDPGSRSLHLDLISGSFHLVAIESRAVITRARHFSMETSNLNLMLYRQLLRQFTHDGSNQNR